MSNAKNSKIVSVWRPRITVSDKSKRRQRKNLRQKTIASFASELKKSIEIVNKKNKLWRFLE